MTVHNMARDCHSSTSHEHKRKLQMPEKFKVIGSISNVETFAVSHSIRDLTRLNRMYGRGRWRKRKGVATIELSNGNIRLAELHWYEAHSIGKREMRRKRFLD